MRIYHFDTNYWRNPRKQSFNFYIQHSDVSQWDMAYN